MNLIWIITPLILFSVVGIQNSFAEEWYVGKNLEVGDYFEYKMYHYEVIMSSDFQMSLWVSDEEEIDGRMVWMMKSIIQNDNESIAGHFTIDQEFPKTITIVDEELSKYLPAFKTLTSLANIAGPIEELPIQNGPQSFDQSFWKSPQIYTVYPNGTETIVTQSGKLETHVLVDRSHFPTRYWVNEELPFLVKEIMYDAFEEVSIITEYELLKFEKNITDDPFESHNSVIEQSASQIDEIRKKSQETSLEHIETPKKQVANGILPKDVLCKYGLDLIFKSTNYSPACVTPESVLKLIERGWGVMHLQDTR